MKLYFKRDAEVELGEPIIYFFEFTNGWPTRQLERCRDTWRWSDRQHDEFPSDQPLDPSEMDDRYSITAEEFEVMWKEAQRHHR
jgi:hypothetical protein